MRQLFSFSAFAGGTTSRRRASVVSEPSRLRALSQAAIAGALWIASAVPAMAVSFTNSTVQLNANGPVSTGNCLPGQSGCSALESVSGTGYLGQALTSYGVNKASSFTATDVNRMLANSQWQVQFTLSGGAPGAFVPLDITYSFHGILGSLVDGQSEAHFQYSLVGGTGATNFLSPLDRISGFQNIGDQCTLFTDPAVGVSSPAFGQCAGTYTYSGTIHSTIDFAVSSGNILSGSISTAANAASADAFSTATILGIIVPNGITWSYNDGITGNPLNFQNVSATPEPAAWSMLGLGLAAVFARRLRSI